VVVGSCAGQGVCQSKVAIAEKEAVRRNSSDSGWDHRFFHREDEERTQRRRVAEEVGHFVVA